MLKGVKFIGSKRQLGWQLYQLTCLEGACHCVSKQHWKHPGTHKSIDNPGECGQLCGIPPFSGYGYTRSPQLTTSLCIELFRLHKVYTWPLWNLYVVA